MTQTALYRHFDAAGRLLYVGISLSAVARASQHRDKPWFADMATMTTEWHQSRDEAHAAERDAIRTENPLHNRQRYGADVATLPAPKSEAKEGHILRWSPDPQEIEDRVAHMDAFRWRTVEGCAALLMIDPDVLRDRLVFIYDRECRLKRTDVQALADMMIRGVLTPDTPWVVGHPLPDHLAQGMAA